MYVVSDGEIVPFLECLVLCFSLFNKSHDHNQLQGSVGNNNNTFVSFSSHQIIIFMCENVRMNFTVVWSKCVIISKGHVFS